MSAKARRQPAMQPRASPRPLNRPNVSHPTPAYQHHASSTSAPAETPRRRSQAAQRACGERQPRGPADTLSQPSVVCIVIRDHEGVLGRRPALCARLCHLLLKRFRPLGLLGHPDHFRHLEHLLKTLLRGELEVRASPCSRTWTYMDSSVTCPTAPLHVLMHGLKLQSKCYGQPMCVIRSPQPQGT